MLGGRAKSAAKPKAAQPQQEASVTESTKPAAPQEAEVDPVKALMRSAEAALGKGPLSPANPVPGWRAECTSREVQGWHVTLTLLSHAQHFVRR